MGSFSPASAEPMPSPIVHDSDHSSRTQTPTPHDKSFPFDSTIQTYHRSAQEPPQSSWQDQRCSPSFQQEYSNLSCMNYRIPNGNVQDPSSDTLEFMNWPPLQKPGHHRVPTPSWFSDDSQSESQPTPPTSHLDLSSTVYDYSSNANTMDYRSMQVQTPETCAVTGPFSSAQAEPESSFSTSQKAEDQVFTSLNTYPNPETESKPSFSTFQMSERHAVAGYNQFSNLQGESLHILLASHTHYHSGVANHGVPQFAHESNPYAYPGHWPASYADTENCSPSVAPYSDSIESTSPRYPEPTTAWWSWPNHDPDPGVFPHTGYLPQPFSPQQNSAEYLPLVAGVYPPMPYPLQDCRPGWLPQDCFWSSQVQQTWPFLQAHTAYSHPFAGF